MTASRAHPAAALAALAACAVNHHVTVTGRDLHDALPALRASGSATVQVTDSPDGEDAHQVPRTLAFDDAVLVEGQWSPLRDVTRHCPDYPPFATDRASAQSCPLVALRDTNLALHDYETRSTGRVLGGAAAAALVAAAIGAPTCELACHDGTLKDASTYTLIGLGVLVVGVLVYCLGSGGDPRCRD